MVSLAGAWIIFPALLGLASLGWGLLVEAAAGRRLPGALLMGTGFAALAATAQLPALGADTAPFTVALIVAGAVAGLTLCAAGAGPRDGLRSLRPDTGTTAVALGAFALYGAPVVLSGAPAIAGYIRLDDSATWMALAEHVLENGRGTAGLAPSTHEAAVRSYLDGRYPVGSMLPLAIGGRLAGQDLAWVYAPYLAAMAALLALALDALTASLIPQRGLRAGVAVAASGSALLYGYVLWGGIKEIVATALLATLAALVAWSAAQPDTGRGVVAAARELLPAALCCAALVFALSAAGAVWLVPLLVPLVVRALAGRDLRGAVVRLGVLGALVAAGSVYALTSLDFARTVTTKPVDPGELLGNLFEPLSRWQILGIWPSGDFRLRPEAVTPTAILLVVLALAAGVGIVHCVRRRAWEVLAYGVGIPAAAGIVAIYGWPWVNAKALAIASPAPVLLAGVGVAGLAAWGRRAVAAATGAALALGLAWSDGFAYHDTTFTPHDRHAELADIGARFAGGGPTLLTEFEPHGARWFLREMDAEGASELRRRFVPLTTGELLPKGTSADIDAFRLDGIADYRTLVVRRSPVASRPPSAFELAWRGRWYEVWEQSADAPAVLEHLGLGGELDPGARPRCADLLHLARVAGPRGALRTARARRPIVTRLDAGAVPPRWKPDGRGGLVPSGGGTVRAAFSAPSAGRYQVWLGGAFRGSVTISVDGRRAGRARDQLGYAGLWVPFGTVTLSAGHHAVSVKASRNWLRPGSGGRDQFAIGPVALVRGDVPKSVRRLAPSQARGLCGSRLDWIEAVG